LKIYGDLTEIKSFVRIFLVTLILAVVAGFLLVNYTDLFSETEVTPPQGGSHADENYLGHNLHEPAPVREQREGREVEFPFPQSDYMSGGGLFELPVSGAGGFAAVALTVFSEPNRGSSRVLELDAGQGFTIISEYENWWNINVQGTTGWVQHRYCFINLPDVIPSIVYNITNAQSSVLKASHYAIPNVTGYALYQAHGFNERLGRYEFVVPTLYIMARRIATAQQYALSDGNTLIIYEIFRPAQVQELIVDNMRDLMNANPTVRAGVTSYPWSLGWFINTGTSNHQRAAAMDVSLGRVLYAEMIETGNYEFLNITSYFEFEMQTIMHELSDAAAVFTRPVQVHSPTAWQTARHHQNVTPATLLLQYYCTKAGFIPLASEWWHFNDLASINLAQNIGIRGDFFIERSYSVPPIE